METGYVSLLDAQGQLYYMDEQLLALASEEYLDYLIKFKSDEGSTFLLSLEMTYQVRQLEGGFPWPSLAFLENDDVENLKLIDRQGEWVSLPSAETGKNKLLVQAYLGRKNGTVGVLSDQIFCSWPTAYSLVATNVLLTLENFNYYLVEVNFSLYGGEPATLHFNKLNFSSLSNKIFDFLRYAVSEFGFDAIIADPELVKIFHVLEAYGLSGYRDYELVKTFTLEELTLPEDSGLPLAWGWKANWQGDEMAMVTTYGVLDGGDYSHTNTYLHVVNLTFTEIYEDGVISDYELTTTINTDGPFYFKPHYLRIFVPDILNVAYFRMYQEYFVVQYEDDPEYTDTPLYCYYDAEDQLIVLYCSYTLDATAESDDINPLNKFSCNLQPLLWKSDYYEEPKLDKINTLDIKRLSRTNRATIPSHSLAGDVTIEAGVGSSPAGRVEMTANDIVVTQESTFACSFFKNAFCSPTKEYFDTTRRCKFRIEAGYYDLLREVSATSEVGYVMALLIPYQSSEAFFTAVVRYYHKFGTRITSANAGYLTEPNAHKLTVLSEESSGSGPQVGEVFYTRIHASFSGHVVVFGEGGEALESDFFEDRRATGEIAIFGKSALNVPGFSEEDTGEDSQYLWDAMMNLTVEYPYIDTPFIIQESTNGTIKFTYKWGDFSTSYIEDPEYLKFNNNEANLPTDAEDKKYGVFCGWS
jgi:hypothetical protein